MGQALYRAHRPKKLSEIVGQEHVTTALTRSLAKGTISHAYLLTGPRGTGKTSIGRILAHEINGLPYEDDSMHLDIIEIDAASNRRIDEIRDLRDKVHIAPTSAKYKVYIIDEVHMLTKEAFNALLKTLEEPPAHVVFILATTEVHKLPETIISRTQRFSLKPVDLTKVAALLKDMAKKEGISIDDDALALIAAHGEGSFRDSISLLDQARNTSDKVTLADVQALLGIAPKELIEQIVAALTSHDAVQVAASLGVMHDGGHEPAQIARQLGELLRAQLLAGKPNLPHAELVGLLTKLIEVPSSSSPQSYLEIALLDVALAGVQPVAQAAAPASVTPAAAPAKPAPAKIMTEDVQAKPAVQIEPHPSSLRKAAEPAPKAEVPKADTPTPASDALLDVSSWPAILAAVKAKHNTLFSIVRATQPHFEPGVITLECAFAFHQKRLNENRNKEMLSDIIQSVTGQNLRILCVVGEPVVPDAPTVAALPPAAEQVHTVAQAASAPIAPPAGPPNETVSAISDIFGGAELLQS
jgi:DNA polymerase-3 subunit gamma/tau